jgi:hypothetical protein
MWKRGNNVDTGVWLHTRVIELDLQRLLNYLCGLHMMPVKKNKSLLVIDESRCIYKIDVGYAC